MKIRIFIALVVSACSFSLSYADKVDSSSVTTFQDGTPAVAGEVNGNFQALIDAINDNAARLAALEAASSGSNSVSGHTFELRQIGVMNRARPDEGNSFATTANLAQSYTVAFNSDGSLTLTGVENEGELVLPTNMIVEQSNATPVSETGT